MAYSKHLTALVRIVAGANRILKERFERAGTAVKRLKDYAGIVTTADLAADAYLRKAIRVRFPREMIVSEEDREVKRPAPVTWYVDPLDGTSNFTYGLPDFSTCLARVEAGETELAAIGIPILGEIYAAERGRGAWRNGKRIHVPKKMTARIPFCLLGVGRSPTETRRFKAFIRRAPLGELRVRMLGSLALEFAAVASGQADAAIGMNVNLWDVLPGILLVREAGGVVSNFHGSDWTPKDDTFIACHPGVHTRLLSITKTIR